MSTEAPATLQHSKSAPARSSNIRPTLTLGNQESNLATNGQQVASAPPVKNVEKFSTYYVWSVFNLLLLPFGVLCCYFSHQVSRFKAQNRYEQAKKWSKRTFIVNIITTLLMFGLIITVVMLHYDYVKNNPVAVANQTRTTGAYIAWQPGR